MSDDPIGAAMLANMKRSNAHELGPLWVGIDPGIKGALVLLDPATMKIWKWADMPTVCADGKSSVPATGVADILVEWNSLAESAGRRLCAIVEEVGAMPGQGVTSMFSFGRSFGVLLGVLGALRVPIDLARPAAWKRGARIGSDKGAARKAAQERFPDSADLFARVKDDGRAEAALLARWRAEKGNV